jgi:hypothetical protein
MGKNSFVLSGDHKELFSELTDEQAGKLIKAIFAHEAGEQPELDVDIRLLFIPIRQWLDRNREAYVKACEAHVTAGRRGGRPANQNENNKPNKTKRLISKPKKPDYDPDPVLDNDNESANALIKLPLERAIDDFVEFRKKIKKPMTDHAVELLREKLSKLADNDTDRIAILEQSIVNGWQGVFELKQDKSRASPPVSQKPQTNNPFFDAAKRMGDDHG